LSAQKAALSIRVDAKDFAMRCLSTRAVGFLLFLILVWPVPSTPANGAKAGADKDKSSNQSKKYVWPTDPALYVGPETCKTCHEDIYNDWAATPHFVTTMEGKLEANKGPEWHGCEACHGPGKEHVDGGGDKTKIFTFQDASPAETSDRCLRCRTDWLRVPVTRF
jgi:hypothetical protein